MPLGEFIKQVEATAKRIQEEPEFQKAYAAYAKKTKLAPNPDDKEHYYDYRAAWRAGELNPNKENHLSSKYKREGHPRLYMTPDEKQFFREPKEGLIDTRTGKPVKVQP